MPVRKLLGASAWLALLLPDLLSAADQVQGSVPPQLAAGASAIHAGHLMSHIKRLASDEFEGRGPATRGETLTVNYLQEQFRQIGLKPGNPDGSFIQKVPLVGYDSNPRIDIEANGRAIELNFPADFVHDFPALRHEATSRQAGVVFAGYGIVAPEFGWDDYRDTDVRNKLVLVLSGEPSRVSAGDPKGVDPAFFKGEMRTYYSTRESKFDLAAARGAAGILVVYDPAKSNTYSLFQTFARMEGFALKPPHTHDRTLISGLITLDAARRVLALAGEDIEKLQSAASLPGAQAITTTARASIKVQSRIRHVISRNVVARIEGSDPELRNEYLVYSAHWDHLGKDVRLGGDQIYNGAIDNAVGTAQLLEVARAFAALELKPKRSILFIATTAEEKGYLGSRYYARHPLYPLEKTIANINLDGGNVWGITSDLITTGYGLSTLDDFLGAAARMQGRTFVNESLDDGGLYFGSDQIEFAKVGIPAAFPFSGSSYVGRPADFAEKVWSEYSEKDYHQVSDDFRADWNLSGAEEDSKWLMIAGWLVADADTRPAWKAGSEFRR